MTDSKRGSEPHDRPTRLTPGNWVAIAAIAVTVLGGILGGILSIALGEHNRRIAGIETGQDQLVAAQAQLAGSQAALAGSQAELAASQAELAVSQAELGGEMKALNERLNAIDQRFTERFDRMEASIERLLQLHMAADRRTPRGGQRGS